MKNVRLESGVNCFYARKNQQGEYSEIIMPDKQTRRKEWRENN